MVPLYTAGTRPWSVVPGCYRRVKTWAGAPHIARKTELHSFSTSFLSLAFASGCAFSIPSCPQVLLYEELRCVCFGSCQRPLEASENPPAIAKGHWGPPRNQFGSCQKASILQEP